MANNLASKATETAGGVVSEGLNTLKNAVYKFTDYLGSLGRISSNYGMRKHPISGQYKMHNGIDVVLSDNNIPAFTGGTVVRSGYQSNGYGYQIMIEDSKGNYHLYAHLAGNPYYKVGDTVPTGSIIGVQGTSGSSTGVHLHYEIRSDQNSTASSIDPNEYYSGGYSLVGLSGAVTGGSSSGSVIQTGLFDGSELLHSILKFVLIFALVAVAVVFLLQAFNVDIKGTAMAVATKGMIK